MEFGGVVPGNFDNLNGISGFRNWNFGRPGAEYWGVEVGVLGGRAHVLLGLRPRARVETFLRPQPEIAAIWPEISTIWVEIWTDGLGFRESSRDFPAIAF